MYRIITFYDDGKVGYAYYTRAAGPNGLKGYLYNADSPQARYWRSHVVVGKGNKRAWWE